ncbi:dimethyl sulfoxide reductase anchor subunit [Cytobacillus spongiae]|jgi:anaerobic dimethyl sulfoxide reductase subunit C (anchor subunit)|uniref:dimethyl sulfoxide reductase anchor subunit family protein n=1 Tax=Cytobacillus spongiae TaxID=2901381 RepID=UPI001F3D7D49|nr:DmsC/YnfH family molybdoenzyme membrane anchor subunit [Cytobacillus spongiae]UII56573.1 dimethyl sulfoxide reductase anchor subunit [Cytobacillus spongiae]
MFAEEWPLLLFTLLTQFGVGAYIFFVIIRAYNKKLGNNLGINVTKRGLFLVGPVLALALVFSLFHLGDPFGAYRSLLNLDSSWLSREIVFTAAFFALWGVSFYLDLKRKWNQIVGWVTSFVGLGAIFCMASIYASSIKPAWTDVNTYLAFYGTTILFGSVTSMIFILISKEEKTEALTSVIKGIGLVGLGAMIAQLIYLPIYVSGLSGSGQAGLESASLITGTYAISTVIRWALSFIGIGTIGFLLYRDRREKSQMTLYLVALTLVLVGEFLGRYIFYATGVSIIVG